MSYKQSLKWGDKWATGRMIFLIILGLSIILFINRYNLILLQNEFTDFGIKESVKYWKEGFLQLIRSFFEHFSFNFIVPIMFAIFSLGFDRLFNKYCNWRFAFSVGVIASMIITFSWEFKHRPIEWIEIIYDLSAVLLSYLFISWMLREFDQNIKNSLKKSKVKRKNN